MARPVNNQGKTAVTDGASVELLPVMDQRTGLWIRNPVGSGGRMHVAFGRAATTNDMPVEEGGIVLIVPGPPTDSVNAIGAAGFSADIHRLQW